MSLSEPIAIVGLACQYPDARSPSELWENVLAQRRAFRRMPSVRLRLEDYGSKDKAAPDVTYVENAAVIEGYTFDRVRYRVAGSTFRSADLTHWLALDVAAEALRDAGFEDGEGLPRETTGVVLGNTLTGEFSRASLMRLRWPYVRHVVEDGLRQAGWGPEHVAPFLSRLEAQYKSPFAPVGEETLAGGLANTIAGRVCNHFDLKGGGFSVDGACASSLLAFTQACGALAAGDLDVALAGGVDLSLDPFELVGFAKTGALAPEEMRVYDARSAGFWPGEGCGFAVLMRASEAQKRGLRIRALIRGWGVSSDGQGGITRPEVEGQVLALRRAYRRAGFGADTVGYFEGHGTGTAVGDATELQAVSKAIRETGGSHRVLAAIGSVKANIGHTKAAAGIAGIIKATMALQAQVLPPTTGNSRPHSVLTGEKPALRVLSDAESWPSDRALRASVSAMGFGGINTHIVLEGASPSRRRALTDRERRLADSAQDAEVFFLGASGPEALAEAVRTLRAVAPGLSRSELADAANESQRRISGQRARAAVVASTPTELVERLDTLAGWLAEGVASRVDVKKGVFLGAGSRPVRVGFLFPGQGSPSRRDAGVWQRRFPTVRELYAHHSVPEGANLVSTDVAQPAIVQASLAGLRVLAQLGIEASAAVGHSLGELVALHWAAAMDEAGVLQLARVRGRAMADLGAPSGAMASLGTDAATAETLLAGLPVNIAGRNSPKQTVVAGEGRGVDEVLARARAKGIPGVRLEVSHAFHSPLVAPAVPPLAAHLSQAKLAPLAGTVLSTVTGGPLSADADLRALLCQQVTGPVRFIDALASAERVDLWLEVGPGHVLSGLASDAVSVPVISLEVGGDSLRGLLHAVAAAFVLGAPCQTDALFSGRFTRPFSFQRKPSFFENPCEQLPGSQAEAQPVTVVQAAAPTPVRAVAVAAHMPSAPLPVPTHAPAAGTAAPAVSTSPAQDDAEPLAVIRSLVAARAELPESAIQDDHRLLGDLHLNSISVSQLVIEATKRLGMAPPTAPLEYAHATVRSVAQALEELRSTGGTSVADSGPALPAGVDAWVRPFSIEWVTQARPNVAPAAGTTGGWNVLAPADHPFAAELRARLDAAGFGPGVAVCLSAEPNVEDAARLLRAARAVSLSSGPKRFLAVQHGGGASAFARTLHQELPSVVTCVVDVPVGHPSALDWLVAEATSATGYTESRYDADGVRRVPTLKLLPPAAPAPMPIGASDVLLVTGGGKGIAAECALDVAKHTGAKLGLLGRSRPEKDTELAANLARMREAGVRLHYVSADVTDADAVARAVREVETELGPVTAVLHGAGANTPRLLSDLDDAALRTTLGPKYDGARNMLAAVNQERLRLFIGFGSIIGRMGMVGEADYALANEWLTLLTERLQAKHPSCRCVSLEWSIWSGVGMGERLGRVDALARQGITPIPPDQGVALMRELLAHPALPTALVISGRLGEQSSRALTLPELPFLRFVEQVRVQYPGIELVVDAELSGESDLSLDDHVFRGERLVPAVLGLEAMAQVAMALEQRDAPPTFERVAFERPIIVPPGTRQKVRVAALVRAPGTVEVVLRCEQTGFQADHFRATCRWPEAPVLAPLAPIPAEERAALASLDPMKDLYGSLFFHGGRFRRITRYHRLRATECLVELGAPPEAPWFARFLPGTLVLGDPSARDAALHAIQACIPHGLLLPVGVDTIHRTNAPGEARFIHARELSSDGRVFVYDVTLYTADGQPLERWERLRLQRMEAASTVSAWPAALLAPYVERRVGELLLGAALHVALEPGAESPVSGEHTLRWLLGAAVPYRPDGKPVPHEGGASAAHAGHLTLAVAGPGEVGCDLQTVEARPADIWRQLLGPERMALAELVTREHGEAPDVAATRVWSALECLKKAGLPSDTPLLLASAERDGWIVFSAGHRQVATLRTSVQGEQSALVVAALPGGTDARV